MRARQLHRQPRAIQILPWSLALLSSCLCLLFLLVLTKLRFAGVPKWGFWLGPNCTAWGVKVHVNLLLLVDLSVLIILVVLFILVSLIIPVRVIRHGRLCM